MQTDDGYRAVAFELGKSLEAAQARIRELEAQLAALSPASETHWTIADGWPAGEDAKKFVDGYPRQPESADREVSE